MGHLANLIASAQRGPNDELYTPNWVVEILAPYLPNDKVIWESAPGSGAIVSRLFELGFEVIAAWRLDFFETYAGPGGLILGDWDVQVTNPPYSKKAAWLKRSEELGKPWALLLPITTWGNARCHPYLADVEMIWLPRRVDFTGKGRPWFSVAWFTKGLNIGRPHNFAKVPRE